MLAKLKNSLWNSQCGFTLIEMSMSMIASAIVLVGISVIVSGSYEHLKSATQKINLQQDFTFLELFLSNNLTQSSQTEFKIYSSYSDYKKGKPSQNSGSCMRLKHLQSGWKIYYQDNSDFKVMDSNSNVTTLVRKVVSEIKFTSQSNSILTFISLSQGGQKIEGSLVNAFRN